MNKRFAAVLVFGFVLVIGLFGFQMLNKSTITISINGADAVSRTVTVDSKSLVAQGEGGKNYLARVGLGNHKLVIKAPGYKDYSIDIKTSFREDKALDAALSKASAAEIAAGIKSVPVSRIASTRFFGNENWLVFLVSSNSDRGDGFIVIARFSLEEARWVLAEEGTDFDFNSPSLKNAPAELVAYIKSL